MNLDYRELAAHDAFRWRGLGKSAAEAYWRLLREPLTVCGIQEKTGCGRATVFRVLKRMLKITDPATGEIFQMVEKAGSDNWKALETDLDTIAKVIGTAGKAARQRKQHREERRRWHSR